MVKGAIALSVCGRLAVCLIYRWKAVEESNAWVFRGRKQHDFLQRSLKLMWPKKALDAAAEELRRLGESSLTDRAKATLKATTILQFFLEDPGGVKHEAALLLNAPLQHFLNKTLAAEKAVSIFVELASAQLSNDASCTETDKLTEARGIAQKKNWEIISGAAGKTAMRECVVMMGSYTTGKWENLAMSREDKFKLCYGLLGLLGETWWRTEFYYNQPKFQVFEAGIAPDDAAAEVLAKNIQSRADKCSSCVDRFSLKWVQRLLDARVKQRARRSLSQLLAAIRVCSAKVEKKHLLGQDCYINI